MINYICKNNTKQQPRLAILLCWIGETKKDNVSHIYKLWATLKDNDSEQNNEQT
jgi:hypothetical protein